MELLARRAHQSEKKSEPRMPRSQRPIGPNYKWIASLTSTNTSRNNAGISSGIIGRAKA